MMSMTLVRLDEERGQRACGDDAIAEGEKGS